ncbi:MAG: N-6 DNA methylase [Acidimicrobiales bacterium]
MGDISSAVVFRWLASGDAGDLDAFDELLHPDAVIHAPAGLSTTSADEADPELAAHRVGELHERRLELAGDRKRGGVYYTPPDVVEHLLDMALDPILQDCGDSVDRVRALRVLDPACGSGNFLSAAGDRIRQRLEVLGTPASQAAAAAFGGCLVGIDIDPAAVGLCVASLAHASRGTVTEAAMSDQIHCADTLGLVAAEAALLRSFSWQRIKGDVGVPEGFDLVIGNPPFLSQLASETARSEECTARLRQRFGPSVAGLTDTAVLFLVLAVDAAKSTDGVICLILSTPPQY